jgi:anhydro-N-acetylmuramic acid kinase
MAAGGQGAPMVAFGDLKLFSAPSVARSVHNLGGISNLSYLPADGDSDGVFAFDTGPASCLIDEAAARDFGLDFDRDGALAARGRVDATALERLLAHPYLSQGLPKTTGREVFTLSEFAADLAGLAGHDLLATLTAFTSESIARAYRDFVLPGGLDEILVAGGGAHNKALLAGLRARLTVPVRTFEDMGWRAKDREALAFAVMAYYAHHGLPNTLPRATGARHPVIAGKLSRPWQGDG